jgi:hypothetical protein
MKRAVIGIALLLVLAYVPFKSLWGQERQHMLDGTFTIITDARQLPASVKDEFTPQGSSSMDMANPGEKFQITDVVVDKKLPWNRLIFAALSSDKCIIHYERGGRAHSYYAKVYGVAPKQRATLLWTGALMQPACNLTELRSMVANSANVHVH